jgi:hypothetical protein
MIVVRKSRTFSTAGGIARQLPPGFPYVIRIWACRHAKIGAPEHSSHLDPRPPCYASANHGALYGICIISEGDHNNNYDSN